MSRLIFNKFLSADYEGIKQGRLKFYNWTQPWKLGGKIAPTWKDIILHGNTALTLVNSKAGGLNYLKLFGGTEQLPETYLDTVVLSGGCEQRNLPEGYTQVNGVTGDGDNYINLNTTLTQDDEIELVFSYSTADLTRQQVFGSRTSASADNISVFFGGTGNRLVIDFNNSDYTNYRLLADLTPNTKYKVLISKNRRAVYQGSTLIAENTTVCNDTITITNPFLYYVNGNPAYIGVSAIFSGTIYSLKINGKRVMTSCKQSTSAGFYDSVSDSMFALTNGTAGADVVPSPDTPIDIVCNNGTIKIKDDELPTGYKRILGLTMNNDCYYKIDDFYLTGADTIKFAYSYNGTACNVLGSYTTSSAQDNLSLYIGTSSSAKYLRYNGGTYSSYSIADKRYDVQITPTGSIGMETEATWTEKSFTCPVEFLIGVTSENATSSKLIGDLYENIEVVGRLKLIPCERLSDNEIVYYDTYTGTVYEPIGTTPTSLGYDYSHMVVYIDGTQEVVTDSEGNTANAERLLAVGNYKDTQEVLSGSVTRKVGIRILNGTENWYPSGSYNGLFYIDNEFPQVALPNTPICTHFTGASSTVTSANLPDKSIRCGYSGFTKSLYVKNTYFGLNVNTLKQWLADQYNAGTPVIIVYPLATATTESVSGQFLSKSPVTQTAGSISNLPIAITESQKTVPTPQHPLDINCNNGVVKVSPNVFDKNDTDQYFGAYVNSNTGVLTSYSFGYCFCVPCKPNTTYTLSGMTSNSTWGSFTSNEIGTTATARTVGNGSLTTGANDKYLIGIAYTTTSNPIDYRDTLQIEQGTTATTYMPYGQIYVDGTTETVEITGKNLFDKTAITEGYYYNASGEYTQSNEAGLSDYIPVVSGEDYTLTTSLATGASKGANRRINYFDKNKTWLSQGVSQQTTSTSSVTVTIPNNAKYLRISMSYTGNYAIDYNSIQLELGSTATDYEPYFNGGSALAENLLKVGTYQDVQSVLDGSVTRKVGIKVLDGTEDGWLRGTNTIYIDGLFNDAIGYSSNNPAITCSHFRGLPPSTSISNMPDLSAKLGGAQYPRRLYFAYDAMTTATQFKQFLADQYANGTPVIVVYPLATATTETVTAQPLAIQAGTNIVEITQASMDNLELEVSYKAGVEVTVTEIENAQLDNSVEVTVNG